MGSPITYGPAVSLHGRIPIQFRSLPEGQSGQTEIDPSIRTLVESLFKSPSQIPDQRSHGTLVIDPNSSDIHSIADVGTTIRHEDTHAILYPLGESAMTAAKESPFYGEIANALMAAQRGGRMAQEVPAYVASNDPRVKVDPLHKTAFWKGYMDQINTLDPKIAKQLQSFGPGQVPAGFEATEFGK